MRRSSIVASVAVLVALAAGCQPPPPPGYQPPKILSVAVSESVVAGQDLTVAVAATDDQAIERVLVLFEVPESVASSQFLRVPTIPCDLPTFPANAVISLEFTCPTPEWAPNGVWKATVWVQDRGHDGRFGARASTTFELSGGSDDVTPPTLESVVVEPDHVRVGDPVTFTIRAIDEQPLVLESTMTFQQDSTPWVSCPRTARTDIAPNHVEVTYSCPPTVNERLGTGTFLVADRQGNVARLDHRVTVSPAG